MLIRITNGSVSAGGKNILSRFSLTIKEGEKVGVVGPNGSGKTTLCRLLAGELSLDRDDKRQGPGIEYARSFSAWALPQTYVFDAGLTVEAWLGALREGEAFRARKEDGQIGGAALDARKEDGKAGAWGSRARKEDGQAGVWDFQARKEDGQAGVWGKPAAELAAREKKLKKLARRLGCLSFLEMPEQRARTMSSLSGGEQIRLRLLHGIDDGTLAIVGQKRVVLNIGNLQNGELAVLAEADARLFRRRIRTERRNGQQHRQQTA